MAKEARRWRHAKQTAREFDIVIAGAGYVGLADRGVASARRGRACRSPSSMPHPQGVWRKRRPRLGHRRGRDAACWTQLGCWDEIAPEAQPITEMIVTDSRTSRSGAARLPDLRRRGRARRALRAHGCERACSTARCARRAAELGIELIEGVGVTGFETGAAGTHRSPCRRRDARDAAARRGRRRASRGCARWPASGP